jgi:hypothetical protein
VKTEDLIARLAADVAPVAAHRAARRFGWLLGLGATATFLLTMVWLGPRPDLAQAVAMPMFWVKLAFPASLAAMALVAIQRLSYPGTPLGRVGAWVCVPVLGVWLAAILALLNAPAPERAAMALGTSWKECSINIAALSAPSLFAAYWAIRGMASTRLVLAGAAAGLFAGATAASAYALRCTEMELPFLGIWYVLGMALPTAVGASLATRLLRW